MFLPKTSNSKISKVNVRLLSHFSSLHIYMTYSNLQGCTKSNLWRQETVSEFMKGYTETPRVTATMFDYLTYIFLSEVALSSFLQSCIIIQNYNLTFNFSTFEFTLYMTC